MLNKLINTFKYRKEKKKIRDIYKKAQISSPSSDVVLFWMMGGMPLLTEIESTIALALVLRGEAVHAVVCDGSYVACVKREASDNKLISTWHNSCKSCMAENSGVLERFGIHYSFIGDYIDEATTVNAANFVKNIQWDMLDKIFSGRINLSKNIKSSVIRYLKGQTVDGQQEVIEEYAFTALITDAASMNIFDKLSPSSIFMSHGVYAEWGPALNNALALGIPVTSYVSCYLPSRFYFKKIRNVDSVNFHRIEDKAWEQLKKQAPLSVPESDRLKFFIEGRYKSQLCSDMKDFHSYSATEIESFIKKYSIDRSKPIWGLMCHINWDNVFDYTPMVYDNFNDWVLDTVKEMIKLADVEWLIKIHPAEAWTNPESGCQKLIEREFPSLPKHIKLVKAEDTINPLNLYELIDGAITVCGTAGLELLTLGKPVILAGKAHYGNKGFTYDGINKKTYKELLHKTIFLEALSEGQHVLAQRYAYCYFIQRQVPLPVFDDFFKFQIKNINKLLPGEDPFYDFICNEILKGQDFIMNEDLVRVAQTMGSAK